MAPSTCSCGEALLVAFGTNQQALAVLLWLSRLVLITCGPSVCWACGAGSAMVGTDPCNTTTPPALPRHAANPQACR